MTWFKRKVQPEPLLDEAEMARLHEEIFDEPVSVERLFHIYGTSRPSSYASYEWVMDQRMLNRIRRLTAPASGAFHAQVSLEDYQIQLIGLPIAVEPLAKLTIRERTP